MPKYMSSVMTIDMYDSMSADMSNFFSYDMPFDMPLGTVRFTGLLNFYIYIYIIVWKKLLCKVEFTLLKTAKFSFSKIHEKNLARKNYFAKE